MSIFYLNKIDNITLCSFQVYNKIIWFYMYCEISLQNDVTINLVNIHHHQVSLFIFLSSSTDLIISFSLGAHAFPKLVEKKIQQLTSATSSPTQGHESRWSSVFSILQGPNFTRHVSLEHSGRIKAGSYSWAELTQEKYKTSLKQYQWGEEVTVADPY